MDEYRPDPKREKEDMIRCANFIIEMVEIYGAEILENMEAEKKQKEETEK